MKPTKVECGLWDAKVDATFFYGEDFREALKEIPDNTIDMALAAPPPWSTRDHAAGAVSWQEGRHLPLGMEPDPDSYINHLLDVIDAIMKKVTPTGSLWFHAIDCTYQGSDKYPPNVVAKLHNMRKGQWFHIPSKLIVLLEARGYGFWTRLIPFEKRNPNPPSVAARMPAGESYLIWLCKGERPFYDQQSSRVATSSKAPAGNKQVKRSQPVGRGVPFHHNNMWGADENGNVPEDRLLRSVDLPKYHLEDREQELLRELAEIKDIFDGTDRFLHDETGLPRKFRGTTNSHKTSDQVCWSKALVDILVRSCTSVHGVCPKCQYPWVPGEEGPIPTCRCKQPKPIRPTVMDVFSGGGSAGIDVVRNDRHYIGIDKDLSRLDAALHNVQAVPSGRGRLKHADAVPEAVTGILEMFRDDP